MGLFFFLTDKEDQFRVRNGTLDGLCQRQVRNVEDMQDELHMQDSFVLSPAGFLRLITK